MRRFFWVSILMVWAIAHGYSLAEPAYSASATRPATSTAPACPPTSTPFDTPGTDVVRLAVEGRPQPALCWIQRPAGYAKGQRPPLIVCLHGTDDTAQQMIEFWQARRLRIPAVLVAPQGLGKGWSSDDVPTIRKLFDYLPANVWYDSRRVLLAGFSAGGAMTFQMIYKEKVPVTAAVCLANYVPPRLSAEDIRDRRQLPVFYAVGMADVNHELMRTGLEFLRSAGANVELYHPPIGHVLDPAVAQAALDWFYEQCGREISLEIDQAAKTQEVGSAAERLEQIVSQPAWHEPSQVTAATQALAVLEAPGEASLRSVDGLVQSGEAVRVLKEVELKYGISRLGIAARKKRESLEKDPLIGVQIQQLDSNQRASRALAEYVRAQKFVAAQQLDDAAAVCRNILSSYGDTPAAERAQRLLKLLESRSAK